MRFRAGDLVKLVVARNELGISNIGKIAEVIFVGPVGAMGRWPDGLISGSGDDYSIDYGDGESIGVRDWQLQPINPPEEPKSLTREKEKVV